MDTSTAPRVGKLVQARRLVLGYMGWTPKGELGLNVNLADVQSGDVRNAVAARTSINDILRAEKQLAFDLFDKLGVRLTPKERAAVEQMPTSNVDAFLAYSRGVRFEAEGRYNAAAQEYRQAAGLDPGFKAAEAHLKAVQTAAAGFTPTQQASTTATDRAMNVATDRVNGVFVSPLGSQLILNPAESGEGLARPTTIIITVTVPQ